MLVEANSRATVPKESTAAMPAMLLTVLERGGLSMTPEQFHREKRYLLALSFAKSMLAQGVIDESDLQMIDTKLREKFHPVREGLYPKTA